MNDDTTPGDTAPFEKRIGALEAQASLAARLGAVEARLVAPPPQPWWRNARAVTLITALLAAIVPAVTAVGGLIQNVREETRIKLEQQDRIRQQYLDRVFATGVVEGDRLRLFRLLKRLGADPEFQGWAEEEYDLASDRVDSILARAARADTTIDAIRDSLRRGEQLTTRVVQRLRSEADSLALEVRHLRARVASERGSDVALGMAPLLPPAQVSLTSDPPGAFVRIVAQDLDLGPYRTPARILLRGGRYTAVYRWPGSGYSDGQRTFTHTSAPWGVSEVHLVGERRQASP